MDKENRGIPDAKALFTIYGKGSANSRHIYSPTSIIRTPIIWTFFSGPNFSMSIN